MYAAVWLRVNGKCIEAWRLRKLKRCGSRHKIGRDDDYERWALIPARLMYFLQHE